MFRDYLSWGHHISHLSRGPSRPSRPRSALDSSCVPNSSRLPSTASTNEFLATKTGQNPPVLLAIGKRPSTNEDFPLPCWITMFQMMLARWMALAAGRIQDINPRCSSNELTTCRLKEKHAMIQYPPTMEPGNGK